MDYKMNFTDKILQLANHIREVLSPLITRDYWLLELPYYTNIGDILIWKGTECFLKYFNVRCKYKSSSTTFRRKRIDTDTIILLQGGGNFGDLWNEPHGPQAFRRKIVATYPDNAIIILPQTVFYSNENNIRADSELFSKHNNITICARDKDSYHLLKKYFNINTILLVPDMAFCIPPEQLKKYRGRPSGKDLFLKRTDREFKVDINYAEFINDKKNIDISDWPTMQRQTVYTFLLRCFLWVFLRLSRKIHIMFPKLTDLYAFFFFKPHMIKTGVRFLNKYKKVYTTRLHAAILCCLLNKPFILFDNSYGKNSSFFKTWLHDLDGAEFH
jgi:pyruvyl transferase EpsO